MALIARAFEDAVRVAATHRESNWTPSIAAQLYGALKKSLNVCPGPRLSVTS